MTVKIIFNLVSVCWGGAQGHENHSFITCHSTVTFCSDLLLWHHLLDNPKVSLPGDCDFSVPSSGAIMHCPVCTWKMFLTQHQWWRMWKGKCDDAVGLSLRALPRRKIPENRSSCAPSPVERTLHESAPGDFSNLHLPDPSPSYRVFFIFWSSVIWNNFLCWWVPHTFTPTKKHYTTIIPTHLGTDSERYASFNFQISYCLSVCLSALIPGRNNNHSWSLAAQ